MDGASPGNMPTSLGEVWIGTTNPQWMGPVSTVCGGTINLLGTVAAGLTTCVLGAPAVHPLLDQRKPFSANPDDWYAKISDADVDRIARRVVELLREPKP